MAITYPREPLARFVSVTMDPSEQIAHQAEQGGEAQSVEFGPARWMGEFVLPTLHGADLAEARAWLTSLGNGRERFYARDPLRALPQAYPGGLSSLTRAGGGSFAAGTATSWSISADGRSVTLNGLPASFVITRDDQMHFAWDSWKRYLVRCLETVTANGSGVATVTISPFIDARIVPASATATLLNPECVMKLTPDSWRALVEAGGFARAISFQGRQVIAA